MAWNGGVWCGMVRNSVKLCRIVGNIVEGFGMVGNSGEWCYNMILPMWVFYRHPPGFKASHL